MRLAKCDERYRLAEGIGEAERYLIDSLLGKVLLELKGE